MRSSGDVASDVWCLVVRGGDSQHDLPNFDDFVKCTWWFDAVPCVVASAGIEEGSVVVEVDPPALVDCDLPISVVESSLILEGILTIQRYLHHLCILTVSLRLSRFRHLMSGRGNA